MVQVLEPRVWRSCHLMQNFLIWRGAPNPYSYFSAVLGTSSDIIVTRIYTEAGETAAPLLKFRNRRKFK